MSKRFTRVEVPKEQTWSVEDLFPSWEAWDAEFAALEAEVPKVAAYKGRLAESAAVFKECVNAMEALEERFDRWATYVYLRQAEDGSDPVNQGNMGRAMGLMAASQAAVAFFRSDLLALPDGTVERYMQEEPDLQSLQYYFKRRLADKPYMLSPQTEEILAAYGEVMTSPHIIYERAKSSDMQFPKFMDAQGNERENGLALYEDDYETDEHVQTRRNAFHSFVEGLKRYQNTLGATFATEVKKNVVTARVRGHKSAIDMFLHGQEVSREAYHNLLEIIQSELAPHMRRYAQLRKRVLGLDHLLYCDIEAPLDPEYNPKISYQEAWDLCMESSAVLGPEYAKIMRTARGERWVDWSDNVGKGTGAFCASPYGAHSYILMTWTGAMRGAFTLAHELGHAGHFQLANKYQRSNNTSPSGLFVEAPSTLNELLLGQHIIDKSENPRTRRWVIMQFLATYHHNFVRHLLEGELMQRIYTMAEQGRPVTATVLSETKGEILDSFWGGEVVIDEGAKLTWMRQPHYYMGLYPYTYSAGLTASTAIAQLIREQGAPAVEGYLSALKAGGTKGPLELMAMAGVDFTKPDPIRKAVAYVGSLIDELERLF